MSAPSKSKLQIYDSWDLAKPKTAPRSRLYHLEPIGVGTAHTESCTSYIARLAKEHCLSIHLLFTREFVPLSNNPKFLRAGSTFVSSGNYRLAMKSLNGRGATARDWVEVLERLTLRRGLRFLTMLTWQNVLTHKSLLRTVRAWCPSCLEEQRESEVIVYEHLLWTLGTVEVCLHHQRKLETVCPHCHNQTPPFTFRLRPGHCSRCLGWLGHSKSEKESFVEVDDLKYKLWVAHQMGELISEAPKQPNDPPRENAIRFLPTCIKYAAGGNVTAFADIAGIDRDILYSWLNEKHIPKTDLLLKMCYHIGVSLSDILAKRDVLGKIELNQHFQMLTRNTSRIIHRNSDVARLGLLAALEQDPPPTLRQVADRFGYKRTRSLQYRYPELTKMLTAKQRTSRSPVGQPLGRKTQDPAILKLALQQALEKELPPSLNEIAERLGYQAPSALRRKFGSLCKAIACRRANYRAEHRNSVRIKLSAILLEELPPTLNDVSKRLGYQSSAGLRSRYPELSKAISTRHARYRKTQFENIRHELQAALYQERPACLRRLASRLGRKSGYLRGQFPKECQALVKRHAQFTKKGCLERKEHAKTRIRQLALNLYAKGRHPSIEQIRKASKGPTGLDRAELCAFLREVRRQLGLMSG